MVAGLWINLATLLLEKKIPTHPSILSTDTGLRKRDAPVLKRASVRRSSLILAYP